MLQTSISRLATEAMPVVRQLRQVTEGGGRVYYVVGNHDLVLEHFLDGWLVATISPFLNVTSGEQRIRVEHGHIYDPFFARHPDLYESAAWLAGFALFLSPDTFKLWSNIQKRWESHKRAVADDTLAVSHYYRAADMLLRRGFDTVVFGHTHNAEVVELDAGTYVNGGNWIHDCTYVDIDCGHVTLRSWKPTELVGR
jgi:UDP-2,3-diacylglucosamine pyrophosphatase LpxH